MEVELLDLTNIIRREHPKRNAVDLDREVRQDQEADLEVGWTLTIDAADREVHLVQEVDHEVLQEVDHEVDPAPDLEVDHELEVEHQKTRKREEEAKKDQEAQKRRNRKSGKHHNYFHE